MNSLARHASLAAPLACLLLGVQHACVAQSEWVRYGQGPLLQYQLDSRGDRILDFSSAGYRGGQTPPTAESVVTPDRFVHLSPVSGDNRAQIQAAIDQVSNLSLNSNGFRGVVQLAAGQYDVSDTLNVEASGVIIRGVGDGASPLTDTIIRSTSTNAIRVFNVNSPQHNFHDLPAVGTQVSIVDKVVPAGATSFRVADPGAFSVGDPVNVYRDSSQAWLDSLNPPGGPGSWDADDNKRFDHQQERLVTRIEGDRLFIDVPLAHSIDQREGEGRVFRYRDNRVENVGFENLRGTSVFDASETEVVRGTLQFVDEDHAEQFINFNRMKNGWARGVTGQHFSGSTVSVGSVSRSVSVIDSESIDPVSLVTGGRRYSFNFNGSYSLGVGLTADQGRHSFVNNTTFGGFNRGPNAFVDAVATNALSESGPHQKYSTGTLYDNVSDDLQLGARYSSGTSANHGWVGANHVFWNSTAGTFKIFSPPGARNFLIGSTGTVDPGSNPGTYDSLGQRVTFNDPENPLDSLYVAQRLEQERFPDLERRVYTLGDFDELEADGAGSADEVYVDPVWLTQIDSLSSSFHSGQTVGTFDEDTANRKVPFTFLYDLGEDEEIVSATLTLATKRLGTHSDVDTLWLDSTTDPLTFSASEDWGPLYDGNLQVLSIEMVGELGFLEDGQLNGVLSDDRPIDWAHLELVVGPRTTAAGDFNGDGLVNAADYTLWRDTTDSTTDLRADANRDGVVDGADYTRWTSDFGLSGPGTPAFAVPEPGCLILALAMVGGASRRRA